MKKIILIGLLMLIILVSGCVEEQKGCTLEAKICPDGSTVGRVGPNCEFDPCPTQEYTFDWSDGSCDADSDCQELEYGCGGGHIVCTNNPEKWKDMMSTCDIVANHPVKEGYQCGCVLSENKCGWVK